MERIDDAASWRIAQLTGIAVLLVGIAAAIVAASAGWWFRTVVITGAIAPAVLVSMLTVEAVLRSRFEEL